MRNDPVEVLSPAASEPVTVDALMAHLRLNDASEDTLLTEFLASARELFEKYTGRAVLPTTFRQYLPCLGRTELLRGKVLSLEQVQYYDADGVQQTAPPGWLLDAAGVPAVVYLPGGSYPATDARRPRPATVDFTAGWPDAASVPRAVLVAIKLLAAHWYTFREEYQPGAALQQLPMGFRTVCDLYDTGLTRGA